MLGFCKRWALGLFLAVLCGCSSSSSDQNWFDQNHKVKVLSTLAMIDDLVGQVGGDRVDHLSLIKGEIDPHSYELVKGDDEKLSHSDIVFFNGLQLEHGASLCCKLQKHPFAVAVGDHVSKAHPELILTVAGRTDPHIWMDIATWQYVIDPIVEALVKADPEGELYYKTNAELLRGKMLLVHEEIYTSLQKIAPEKRFLVTSHDAFGYFTRSYLATPEEQAAGNWTKRFAAPEGLAPDGQLSTTDIQSIIDHLSSHSISVVFPESNVSQDSLRKIVSACKGKKQEVRFSKEVLYGDAMGPYDSEASSYLEMIRHNANSLLKEWQ
jgi:manganese/zinc/iron transport system substrate-binding protein